MKRVGSSDENWRELWRGICEVAATFPSGVVFIGGIAVYLHSVKAGVPKNYVERSHDADLYVALSVFDDLRSVEDVTTNIRLRKKQFIKYGMDYDVYLEHHHGLRVRYDDIFRYSSVINGVRVASLEHLLILKLDALTGRAGTSKGRKDERDVIRIAMLLGKQGTIRVPLQSYFTSEMARVLERLASSHEFMTISRGNAHEAKRLRTQYTQIAGSLCKRLTQPSPRRRLQ
jgi:hypothetical protein